jgi:predicted ATP-dependent protease
VEKDGQALTEKEAAELPRERRAEFDRAEHELHGEINRFLEKTGAMERVMNEARAELRREVVRPMLEHELQAIRVGLKKQIKDSVKLGAWLDEVERDVLENVELFEVFEPDDESRREALEATLARYRVNLVVDNEGLSGAPVIVENNPLFRALFGSIEYQAENDVLVTDFSRIRAGSLLKAHGGFLMLHLRDLVADPLVWEKLRRFLRNGRLQIEEPGTMSSSMGAVSLEPQAVDVDVKIVLIGAVGALLRAAGRRPRVRPPLPGQGRFRRQLHCHRGHAPRHRHLRGAGLPPAGAAAFFSGGGGASGGGDAPRSR